MSTTAAGVSHTGRRMIIHPKYIAHFESMVQRTDKHRCRHFINLTNGIEALPYFERYMPQEPLHFVRIQSSQLESSDYEGMFSTLDANFLMHLSLGYECYVYDFGVRRDNVGERFYGMSRACWQGLTFVKWALDRMWYQNTACDKTIDPWLLPQFRQYGKQLTPKTETRIKYFRRYIDRQRDGETGVKLFPVSDITKKDGDKEYYGALADAHFRDGVMLSSPSLAPQDDETDKMNMNDAKFE